MDNRRGLYRDNIPVLVPRDGNARPSTPSCRRSTARRSAQRWQASLGPKAIGSATAPSGRSLGPESQDPLSCRAFAWKADPWRMAARSTTPRGTGQTPTAVRLCEAGIAVFHSAELLFIHQSHGLL